MEIITYVRTGAITHQDSMGNKGRTGAGDVQVMCAGHRRPPCRIQSRGRGDDAVPDLAADRQARRHAELGREAIPEGRSPGPFVTLASGFEEDGDALPINAAARVLGATLKAGETRRARRSIRRATPIWSRPAARSRSTAAAPKPATASPSPARRM